VKGGGKYDKGARTQWCENRAARRGGVTTQRWPWRKAYGGAAEEEGKYCGLKY